MVTASWRRKGQVVLAAAGALSAEAVGRRPLCGWVCLLYHAVCRRDREGFARQMAAVADRTVPTSEIGQLANVDGALRVCVSFDDGFESVLHNAAPVLAVREIPATVFAVSGNLGQRHLWPMPWGHADTGQRVMSESELRQLPASLVTIGSHGVTHRPLNALPRDEVRAELKDSKAALEDVLGRPVRAFAFPHGAYDDSSVGLAFEMGYEQLFTIEPCVHPGPLGPGLIGRVEATPQDDLRTLRLKASGAYDWVYYARRIKRRVVGMERRSAGHQVWAGQ